MLLMGPLITICVLALAFALGDRSQREGAAVITVTSVLALVLGWVGQPHDQFPAALSDVVLMGGLVFLTFRHRRLWLYAEVAVALALVTAQLAHDDMLSPSPQFRLLINGLDLVGLGTLLAVTLVTRALKRPSMISIAR